jgi:inorganic pyrophosphatase
MQDTRKNIYDGKIELRYYAQFPYFSYGFLPQTWEQDIRPEDGLLVRIDIFRAITTHSILSMLVQEGGILEAFV